MPVDQTNDTRFQFGNNWMKFASHELTFDSFQAAREGFHRLLPPSDLKDRTFLDVGFGQGIALILAAEGGADVYGIDVDPKCIDALLMTQKKIGTDFKPTVRVASILDMTVGNLFPVETFDIVHSWGVLHHTGSMWEAINACLSLVKPGGLFVMSIYNEHWSSPIWKQIKYAYNHLPSIGQRLMVYSLYPLILLAKFVVTRKNPFIKERGMNFYRDVVDWVGGYPYEYASARDLEDYISQRGWIRKRFFPAQVPTGCNEFVFERPG